MTDSLSGDFGPFLRRHLEERNYTPNTIDQCVKSASFEYDLENQQCRISFVLPPERIAIVIKGRHP